MFKQDQAITGYQQAHVAADTDLEPSSIHHTLGGGPNHAAPGNHNHDTTYDALNTYSDARAVILSHRCRALKGDSTTQAIGSGGTDNTVVTLSGTEYDPEGMFDNANDKIDIPADGTYAITGTLHWDSPAAACTRLCIIRVNDKIVAVGNAPYSTGTNNNYSNSSAAFTGYLSNNDTVKLAAYQNSGGNLDVEGWTYTISKIGCYLTVIRID